jgi:hypothetical protein
VRAILGFLAVLLLVACAGTEGGMPGSSAATNVTSSPEHTPTPTARPAPTPLALSGQGSKVTAPFHLDAGNYRVSWTATGESTNFIVHIRAGQQVQYLISEIPPKPSSGEAFFQAAGGDYFLEVDASTLSWTITFAPVGA